DNDLEAAWDEVFEALPAAWSVGRPSYHDERHEWTQYAFDPREMPKVGARSREWSALGAASGRRSARRRSRSSRRWLAACGSLARVGCLSRDASAVSPMAAYTLGVRNDAGDFRAVEASIANLTE